MPTLAASLSAHLAERLCQPEAQPDPGGELVLYWMRGSLRADENPALDAAAELAEALGVPLLVYQGLDERHPHSCDRHHAFILEGARDVARELEARGVRHVLHVTRPGHRQPALRKLASRSAVVVTERVPVPPLVEWTARLRAAIEAPVVEVDAACIVPLSLVERLPARAFGFRKATEQLRRERLTAPWPASDARPRRFEGELPFEPVELERTDLYDLIGACEIDHSVGPVPGERGGSVAGSARWEAFRDQGLRSYDRTRNEALLDGVSRLSAYLHHGMVSPLRVAREAAAADSRGATKWLDELLVWREIAWAWCHHRDGCVESYDALPEWARATLEEHRGDLRAPRTSEQLARGRTGDALWDAAQAALLMRGELHNNVRMTWGKQLLPWSATPEIALRRLIDLNHRYALDGRDPASYGGLLWCLGLFDRPFVPDVPIFGSLRPRDTEIHARRLDPATYRARVARPGAARPLRVAVIGGGVAGLTAARTLADAGHDALVFDKGRGPGGRISTRRAEPFAFDHGAQYFTARDARFRRWVEAWMEAGVVQRWTGRIVAIDKPLADGAAQVEKSDTERLVGAPGMNAIARHLAEDLDVRSGVRVAGLERSGDVWSLTDEHGAAVGEFDALVCSLPAEQAAELLAPVHAGLAGQAAGVPMKPTIAVLLGFEARLELDFDGAFVNTGPLSWIARNSSKPGRPRHEAWILHAGPELSMERWDADREETVDLLIAELARVTGVALPPIAHRDLHRWRYALSDKALDPKAGGGCLADDAAGLALCGDWCAGGRVEGAFLSGQAAAARLLRQVARLA